MPHGNLIDGEGILLARERGLCRRASRSMLDLSRVDPEQMGIEHKI